MRYLFLLAGLCLLLVSACSKTASLRAGTSGFDATSSSTVRDPYSGSSATIRADDDTGVTTSTSKPSWTRYRPPVITESIGGATVRIDTSSGDITATDKLGPFFVKADDGGVSLNKNADRWEFADACYVNGVSMYVDSDGDVHVSEPSVDVYNDHVRAGLQKDHFDVVWRGVDFNTALGSLDGIANVRLDARAGEDGFDISAVPSLNLTLLDVSADYAVHRLASHADLKVYVEAEEEYVLSSD